MVSDEIEIEKHLFNLAEAYDSLNEESKREGYKSLIRLLEVGVLNGNENSKNVLERIKTYLPIHEIKNGDVPAIYNVEIEGILEALHAAYHELQKERMIDEK